VEAGGRRFAHCAMRFAMHGSSRRKKTLNYLRFTIADFQHFRISAFPMSVFSFYKCTLTDPIAGFTGSATR
jgi:hypothetical protein